jgi:hypothetical protein
MNYELRQHFNGEELTLRLLKLNIKQGKLETEDYSIEDTL